MRPSRDKTVKFGLHRERAQVVKGARGQFASHHPASRPGEKFRLGVHKALCKMNLVVGYGKRTVITSRGITCQYVQMHICANVPV